MADLSKGVRTTPLGGKVWFSAIVFGLVGQIAWIVENMYFATFAQDIFTNSGRGDMSYIVTTLMVIFSAITATVTTIFAGGLCDKTGKRKPFVAFGYIAWGLTIMIFATIPMHPAAKEIGFIAFLLVIFDCVMTLAGSTANDAAFNTWVTDVTDATNRGKVDTILSILPVIATIIVFVGLGSIYNSKNESNALFFIILGAIPMVAGVLALITMKDSKNVIKNQNPGYFKETFYGFRPEVAKQNKMLYVCLAASCILGISQQTFMSYLINFVVNTLGIKDYFIPLAVVILGSAVITGIVGVLYDKFGRKHFFFPLLAVLIVGTLGLFLLKFADTSLYLPILYVGGIIMLGAMLSLGGAMMATFRDYIPHGAEGRFQGVRMCFTVMIPMIVGPLITLGIGLSDANTGAADFKPPFVIFLAAAVIAVLAIIPVYFVRKDSGRLRKTLIDQRDDNVTIPTIFGEDTVTMFHSNVDINNEKEVKDWIKDNK